MRSWWKFLSSCAVAVCLAPAAVQAQQSVTIASWGGAYQDAQRKAWFEPAARDLGIVIKEDTTSGVADVRAQVMSGAVTWDIVQLGASSCILLEQEGALEKLDYSQMDVAGVPDHMKSDYWIGDLVYGAVLAWRKDAWGGKQPNSWVDFFDTETFPGPRSMRRSPLYNLESALIADGVDPKDLYPLDVDRAFEKLEEIKPHVLTWWNSGAASAQLIADGEVDMISVWNGRVQTVMDEGAPYAYTFNQQYLLFDCWLIPKGAPNKELAMKVLAHMMTPEAQARLPLEINYSPANLDAYETGIIPDDILANLPSAPKNVENAIVFDAQWWTENLDEVTKRFDLFIQE